MFVVYGAILALASFLVGFAWGRRVATFASYHKARRAADLHNGDTR